MITVQLKEAPKALSQKIQSMQLVDRIKTRLKQLAEKHAIVTKIENAKERLIAKMLK